MSAHKIPNSSTTATSFNYPNTIMLRDADGASRVSSLIMKGADFVKECIAGGNLILTNGYIYFANNSNSNYALLRNLETNESRMHLSLDFGKNNKCGNFSIRTEQRTNFIVKNNKIGINQPNPVATLDISGSVIASGIFTANGPMIVNNTLQITNLNQGGAIYSNSMGQLYVADKKSITTPFHITADLSGSTIPFATHSMFVLETNVDVTLPTTNIYDGYTVSIINKSGEEVSILSLDNMFNVFYLPNGGTQFSLEHHRKIDLTYCQVNAGVVSSWIFNTF